MSLQVTGKVPAESRQALGLRFLTTDSAYPPLKTDYNRARSLAPIRKA
jgi:hypothetical protein